MNVALIIAGGIGSRTLREVPKQFLTIDDKPIIIHTLERFEDNDNIDGVVIVCLKGWEEFLETYCKEFNITKVKKIVQGGTSNQNSIFNGLNYIKGIYDNDTNIIIHAANRPFINNKLIDDVVKITNQKGNGIVSTVATDALIGSNDGLTSETIVERNKTYLTQTPQGIKLEKLLEIHKEAQELNIKESASTATLLIETGNKINLITGNNYNIKITKPEDLVIAELFIKNKVI